MRERPARLVAHTPPSSGGDWHYLDDHSFEVAEGASLFTRRFGADTLGFWLGLLHDVGKALEGFQNYLWRCSDAARDGTKPPRSDTPHAAPGAVFADDLLGAMKASSDLRTLIRLVIQAHHTHLREPGVSSSELAELRDRQSISNEQLKAGFREILGMLAVPPPKLRLSRVSSLQLELLIRMLLSALVDADRLSTEQHDSPERFRSRKRTVQAGDLGPALFAHVESMRNESNDLGRIRHEVFTFCRNAASTKGGIFRLTVPTGGGKTLASLSFALERLAGKDGIVVVALPYTSIIEQTAKVYREIPGIGPDNVLEHHSAVEEPDRERVTEQDRRLRAASENWDVPIVVTTTVQLLESLFGNRPSKVRKLHRLAGSVIILDEFQSLPPSLLAPTMDVLRQLSTPVDEGGYGATVVLCTATQPSFDSGELQAVLDGVAIEEIVPTFAEHFAALKRVDYDWRPGTMTWDDVADEIRQHDSALAVLNTRRDALALLNKLKGTPHLYHLSTLLCGAHRQKRLAEVKERLEQRQPVTLVSTQVVECGVDFSFPVVFRAVGPLDRIVQAAGRCNRNFDYPDGGDVIVFDPAEGSEPKGNYARAAEKTGFVMKGQSSNVLHDPDFHRRYFHKLFNDLELDEFKVQPLRDALNFPEVADKYRLISSTTSPVVVQYGDGWKRALDTHLAYPTRSSWKRLQPYIVNLFDYDIRRAGSSIQEVSEGLYFSTVGYHNVRGIDLGDGVYDPSDLFVGPE